MNVAQKSRQHFLLVGHLRFLTCCAIHTNS